MGNTRKPLVIYHDNCADGFAAAFVLWQRLGEDAEYFPMQYGFKPEDMPDYTDRIVYMVDFSWPKERMNDLFEKAYHTIWLDHHKGAFETWCGKYERGMKFTHTNGCYGDNKFDIMLDDNRSGALLAWDWFYRGVAPAFVNAIDDYDRWQFKCNGTRAFQKAIWSHAPWSFEQWEELLGKHNKGGFVKLCEEGTSILRAHEQNVDAVIKSSSRKCRIDDPNFDHNEMPWWDGLIVNCPSHMSSDVGNKLAEMCGGFGLTWYLKKDGTCQCSIRSKGDYDVTRIAKLYGGNGHLNAAGFITTITEVMKWQS